MRSWFSTIKRKAKRLKRQIWAIFLALKNPRTPFIALAIRLIPKDVMAASRREAWKRVASGQKVKSPAGMVAAVLFLLVWAGLIAWVLSFVLRP